MRRYLLLFGLFFLLVFFLSLSHGAVPVDLFHPDELSRRILLEVRLPRVLLAALSGASLSLAGLYFQYVMQNPLADSFTTGASASAALGAVLALLFFGETWVLPSALFLAFLGLVAVLRIASLRGRLLPVTMLLAGIVVNTFASASISLLKFLAQESVASLVFWLMGGFQNATYLRCAGLAAILFGACFYGLYRAPALDLTAFDDETARASGVPLYRLRRELLFLGALLTAVTVSFSGIIGFVGLIVPHLLRLAGFLRAEMLLPLSLLFGASFLVLADLLSRVLLSQGQELPVGVLTSALGGLFFLYLLVKRRRELYELV
ncbi:iron ABC transporter permease [Thermosulfurimonas sp.]|uniref:FecCD family ABC transporter permease n=1 Tax=Thermosulfurimonas sp. TaxID=2080236 RepID=UPI0025F8B302|nr:iron ABC transporter permease [Thermosulfurimonas sp.]